jgi:hypothetical protein
LIKIDEKLSRRRAWLQYLIAALESNPLLRWDKRPQKLSDLILELPPNLSGWRIISALRVINVWPPELQDLALTPKLDGQFEIERILGIPFRFTIKRQCKLLRDFRNLHGHPSEAVFRLP